MTQANTRRDAMHALREAVELWFQSCIERDVLGEAMEECGFDVATPSEPLSSDVESVVISSSVPAEKTTQLSVLAGHKKSDQYIDASFPAHLASKRVEGAECAPV